MTLTSEVSMHQLLITVEDTDPPVWRRLVVPSSYSLSQLHDALQAAFGWQDSHLHEFRIHDQIYSKPDYEDDPPANLADERGVTLVDAVGEGDRFAYTYDFGDGWRHQVLVERVSAEKGARETPELIDGERACPPEDCGGTGQFAMLLAALADDSHPERGEWLEWLDADFDPTDAKLDGFRNRLREQTQSSH